MKTTLDLPEDLLMAAKAVALRRRTSLKAIVEHALRREIGEGRSEPGEVEPFFAVDEHGFPVLRKTGMTPVTGDLVRGLLEDE